MYLQSWLFIAMYDYERANKKDASTASYEPFNKIAFQTWRHQELNNCPLELLASTLPT
jgi:hypothetical protein